MQFKHFAASFAAAALLGICGAAYAAPLVYPTGTTQYDPALAQNGYVLVGGSNMNTNHINTLDRVKKNEKGEWLEIPSTERKLIDMNGNVVHTWKNAPGDRYRILPNGNLLTLNQQAKKVVEYDWDGNVVWEYQTNLGPHHDVQRLPNGNTLILTFENVPVEKLAQVKNVTLPWYGEIKREGVLLKGDSIIEVSPDKKIVWQWNSSDHLDLNTFMPLRPTWDWTHGNTISVIPENKWYDAGDKRFKPGNIIYNPRHFDEFQVIDKDSGKVVWKWSTTAEKGLSNPHEPNMIAKGLPGEGNILIFDNGLFPKNGNHSGQTALYEISPADGKIVWSYFSVTNGTSKFFSKIMSTVCKLPNGNVLTSEDPVGRVLQIKPDPNHPDGGTVVWEYVNESNVARPTFYAYDYCPQMKALPQPKEMKVTPVDPSEWRMLPDELRKDGNFVERIK